MSIPYCSVAYTGTSAAVDGVASVFGPFDQDEADRVTERGNAWVAEQEAAGKYPDVVMFATHTIDPFIGNQFRSP